MSEFEILKALLEKDELTLPEEIAIDHLMLLVGEQQEKIREQQKEIKQLKEELIEVRRQRGNVYFA